MNQTYRLVWSSESGTYIAVSEATRGRGKAGGKASAVSRKSLAGLVVIGSFLVGSVGAESLSVTTSQLGGVSVTGDVDSVTNTARISAQETALKVTGNVVGNILNSGDMASGSLYGLWVTGNVTGNFLNAAGAQLNARNNGLWIEGTVDGNIENRGTISSANNYGIQVGGLMRGNFTNALGAFIRAKDSAVQLSSGLTGHVINRGVIASDADGINVDGAMSGSFTNDVGARINANGEAFYVSSDLTGNITNRGFLGSGSGGYGGAIGVSGNVTGDIVNAAGGQIVADRESVRVGGQLRGNLTNAGKMTSGGVHAVALRGGLVGNITNTATGEIISKESAVRIGLSGQNGGTFQGNFENSGLLVAGNYGAVDIFADVQGNFKNTAGARIMANDHALKQERGDFTGNIENAGLMTGGANAVMLGGRMTGDFTNTNTGLIQSTHYSGVAIVNDHEPDTPRAAGEGLTGNFTNAGTILGNTYSGQIMPGQGSPIIEFPRNGEIQAIRFNNQTVKVPEFIGANPQVGVLIAGGQRGNFTNSGTIRAAQGVFIDGNLTGNWDNTGSITGTFTGLTMTTESDENIPLKGFRNFTGAGSAIIAGNFTGNFRNTVGQTLVVGDHIHDFVPSVTSNTTLRENVATSVRAGTGEADLRGKTVAVHLNGAVSDGYTWDAINAVSLLADPGLSITDNSSLFNFTHTVEGGNLRMTANLVGIAPAPTLSSDVFNGISRGPLNSGLTNTGLVENAGDAISVAGNISGDVVNSGQLRGFNGYGLFVSGDVSGSMTNAAGAEIWAEEGGIRVAGNLTGNFTNAGTLSSSTQSGFSVVGSQEPGIMTGNIVNTSTGRVDAHRDGFFISGQYAGNFLNDGEIIARYQGYGLKVGLDATGSITNSATGRIYAYDHAVSVGASMTGNITNAGEMISGAYGGVDISDAMTGQFLNDVTGKIWTKRDGVRIGGTLLGNVTNLGEISSSFSDGFEVAGLMTGNFTNGQNARIEADEVGVRLNSGLTGNFVNAGEVTGRSSRGVWFGAQMTGNFMNTATGMIASQQKALSFEGGLVGNLTNEGQIRAYGDPFEPSPWDPEQFNAAVQATMITGNVTNTEGAIIESSGDGLLVTGLLDGSLSNAGRITSLDSRGVNLGGGLTGDMSNSGTIESAASDAVRLSGAQGGTLRNSGRIASLGGAGVNLDTGVVGAQIDNTGTITSATAADTVISATAAGTGVYVHAEAGVTAMTNSGTIEGSVNSLNLRNTTGSFAIANTGVLRGDVYLGINTLNLNGEVSRVVGNTANTGGTVNVNGTFTSEGTFNVTNFNVTENGVFNIRHDVTVGNGSGTLNNDGVLATPAQAAAQTVTGHYDQTANGTYRLALADTSTNYGKLAVSGNVKLADASTIDVRLTGTPALSVDTVVRGVITAGGTMTTNANALTVTDNSALFNFNASTSRDAKELDLVITRDAAGLTRAVDPLRPNEAAVASALQTMINNGQPSSLDPLVNALSGLTTDQVTGAMSGLRPAVSGANAQAGMNALRATNNIIQSRVESYRGMSSGDSASERFMWLRALDSSGRQDDRQGISGYKSDMRGLVLGADKPISPRTRVGMAFSSFRGDIRNAGPVAPSSVALDSYQLTGYSSIRTDDRTDVNLQLTLGKNKGASQRLAYAGGTAFANLNSMMVHAGAGVGRMYELGQDASLTPSLRLDYVEVRTDDYAERGATVANLLVNSQKARDLRLTPGVKYVHSFGGGTKFIGNAGLGYDLLNGETLTTASFAGGGPAFVTRAPAQSPWLATAGLALVHEDSKGSEWSLRYDVDSRSSGYRNQSLSVRLRKAF